MNVLKPVSVRSAENVSIEVDKKKKMSKLLRSYGSGRPVRLRTAKRKRSELIDKAFRYE